MYADHSCNSCCTVWPNRYDHTKLLSIRYIEVSNREYIFKFFSFIILLMIPVSLLHEAVHGAVYKIFGGKVIFGFKGIYAYCRETTGITLSRSKFIAILLSPLVSISLLTWLVPHWIVSMVIILNALGSSGDILMFLYLCSKPRCRILDKEYGFDIIME